MGKKTRTFDLRSGFRTGALIAMLERILRSELSNLLVPIGMTYPQFTALMALYHTGPISSAELARILMMTRQSATEMIKQMESREWIVRRSDPQHKKKQLISIVSGGEAALQYADDAAMKIEQRMLGKRTLEQQQQFCWHLQECLTALGESAISTKGG